GGNIRHGKHESTQDQQRGPDPHRTASSDGVAADPRFAALYRLILVHLSHHRLSLFVRSAVPHPRDDFHPDFLPSSAIARLVCFSKVPLPGPSSRSILSGPHSLPDLGSTR